MTSPIFCPIDILKILTEAKAALISEFFFFTTQIPSLSPAGALITIMSAETSFKRLNNSSGLQQVMEVQRVESGDEPSIASGRSAD